MRAVFNDLQDYSSSLDGAAVENRQELFAVLDTARNRDPFVCELEGSNGYKLTFGIAKEFGFIQHSRTDGDGPYLVALSEATPRDGGYFEFLCGDTPTPISDRNILPFEKVKEIAAHFIETGERSSAVSWEQI